MKRQMKTFTIALLVASSAVVGVLPAAAQARGTRAADRTQRVARHGAYGWQMLRVTNESRRRFGLGRLRLDRTASVVARRHTLAMVREHRLFHSTDTSRYLRTVGRWSAWGENIGWTTGGVTDLQKAFMQSPVHRVHILSRSFHHVAVGAVRVGTKLWVTLFFYG